MTEFTIKVNDSIRAKVEAEAKAVCLAAKVNVDSFNQALCAVTLLNCLHSAKDASERLQVAYVCSNASALRQALEKAPAGSAIAESVLGLLKK